MITARTYVKDFGPYGYQVTDYTFLGILLFRRKVQVSGPAYR